MGGSLSTIRWTPYGPVPDSSQSGHHHRHSNHPLRKSKSYPPPPGNNYNPNNNSQHSPSNSTSNLSYEQYTDDEDELFYQNNGGGSGSSGGGGEHGHAGTSGILMGANAPPLYDACLVGRWEDVLEICGESNNTTTAAAVASGEANDVAGGGGDIGGDIGSSDSPNGGETATTHCSSSSEHDTPPFVGRGGDTATVVGMNDDASNSGGSAAQQQQQHTPHLQTRYTDRRRNTPLHLACRRQPPPSVVRALLNHSPCEAVSRRTADGLTPLHFAAYCGAGVEVVSMLVDRMRSDAAVGRAMRLSSAMTVEEEEEKEGNHNNDGSHHRWRLPSEESTMLPPTRLLDRRQRTPLHCALSGFRTPIRPMVVRKLLAVDPASATLGDERGRTPLSLLFDDYAEEIMEALEEDVPAELVRQRTKEGGELHECWKMLRVLLQAAYQGSVSEDEKDENDDNSSRPLQLATGDLGHQGTIGENMDIATMPPQDRQPSTTTKEVNVMEMYDHEHFSMVHAAAGVWECPAPLAKLVLKCQCSTKSDNGDAAAGSSMVRSGSSAAMSNSERNSSADGSGNNDWGNNAIESTDESMASMSDVDTTPAATMSAEKDLIRQRDEETMRLPLHIAVCARPQCREGYSARLKVWLSSPEASRMTAGVCTPRRPSNSSFTSGMSATGSVASTRGRAPPGQVYNPRFGRSPSRDSVAAYSSSLQRGSSHSSNDGGAAGDKNNANSSNFQSFISRSGSNSSIISANLAREPFLQHTMVRDVLELYPAAASVVDDRTGKLPIVLAIEHGKSWETAVGPLLEAYPTPFGGGGDGGMALPDDSVEGRAHRAALQAALFLALSSPEAFVREEAIRTAGKLAKWGGVYGMTGSLDGIVSEWLDTMVEHGSAGAGEASLSTGGAASASGSSPEGIIVGPGATNESGWIQTQSSHLTAVAEVVSHSRPDSISDRVARLCLDTSREYLFSKDGTVREAAARVLGNTLNSVGDADDAANVMREVVLNISNEEGSVAGSTASSARTGGRRKEEDVIVKHGRLLACNYILSTQWGSELMATKDISDAILTFIHACVKDKNTVVRSAAYHAIGPILGKSPVPEDPKLAATTATPVLKEVRSDILKGTRASEQIDVQLALARGLTSASRMRPGVFLCKSGMPIMDAALMLAMSSSTARPNVQKAFQIFLWVALRMGRGGNDDQCHHHGEEDGAAHHHGTGGNADGSSSVPGDPMSSPGLEKYIELAEGENGRIMMKFVTQTLAKIEDLDHQGGLV